MIQSTTTTNASQQSQLAIKCLSQLIDNMLQEYSLALFDLRTAALGYTFSPRSTNTPEDQHAGYKHIERYEIAIYTSQAYGRAVSGVGVAPIWKGSKRADRKLKLCQILRD